VSAEGMIWLVWRLRCGNDAMEIGERSKVGLSPDSHNALGPAQNTGFPLSPTDGGCGHYKGQCKRTARIAGISRFSRRTELSKIRDGGSCASTGLAYDRPSWASYGRRAKNPAPCKVIVMETGSLIRPIREDWLFTGERLEQTYGRLALCTPAIFPSEVSVQYGVRSW
jgi:hypothetical protein